MTCASIAQNDRGYGFEHDSWRSGGRHLQLGPDVAALAHPDLGPAVEAVLRLPQGVA